RPFARLASVSGLVSPSIIAPTIARADTVFKLDATEDNLMEASSNISSNLTISRARSPISWVRYRVNIRNRRISGGGTNDGARNPCSSSCAIHSASRTSLLRPGTAFMCAALSNHTSITSSRQENGGFQYVDVDSIAAMLTPASTSQSRITRNDPDMVLNVRVSARRRPLGPGIRTQTVNVSLPTSSPATRSNMTSIASLPRSPARRPSPHGVGPEGPLPGHRPACSKQKPNGNRAPRVIHLQRARPHQCVPTSPGPPHSHQPAERSKIASPIHLLHHSYVL